MQFSLNDFESKVRLVADNAFIKSIIKNYILIDKKEFNRPVDLYELIYSKMRIDTNSIGKIDQDDKKKFLNELVNDYHTFGDGIKSNPINEQPGWFTFKSWHLLSTAKIHNESQIHRIYINSKAKNLMALSNAIYKEFKNEGIPFYFKMPDNNSNEKGFKDSIVIYTSTELLSPTMNALLNIEKKYPELINNCNSPSEIVGKYNNWIGYASETENAKHSYSSNVCIAVANAIETFIIEWSKKHPDITIDQKTINEYISPSSNNTYEFRQHTQVLISQIPHYYSDFFGELCDRIRQEMINIGLNPNNLCMTNLAQKELNEHMLKNLNFGFEDEINSSISK